MTLPAADLGGGLSIDICRPRPSGDKLTALRCCCDRSTGQTDGRTDGHTVPLPLEERTAPKSRSAPCEH